MQQRLRLQGPHKLPEETSESLKFNHFPSPSCMKPKKAVLDHSCMWWARSYAMDECDWKHIHHSCALSCPTCLNQFFVCP